MTHSNAVTGRSLLLISLIGGAALLAGCSSSSKKPTQPEVPIPPTPNSPINALALVQWSWEQRDTSTYNTVLTQDFIYDFAPADSVPAGTTLNKVEELNSAAHLFTQGVPGHPPATRIVFSLPPTLVVTDDDRPGKISPWHKMINLDNGNARLTIATPTTSY